MEKSINHNEIKIFNDENEINKNIDGHVKPKNTFIVRTSEKLKNISITVWIICINSIFYLFQHLQFSKNILNFDIELSTQMIWKFGSLNFLLVRFNDELYRLITCIYLHNWWLHFLLNMINLYIIGLFLEKIFGRSKYFIIYSITGIIASLTSYYFNFTYVDSLGASGSIFGLVGALTTFIVRYKKKLNPYISKKLFTSLIIVIFLNLGIGYSWNIFISTNIKVDNAGHIGGLVAGLFLGLIFPANIFKENKNTLLYKVLLLSFILITIIAFVWNFHVFFSTQTINDITNYINLN
jgi:rhomboid protease GluP